LFPDNFITMQTRKKFYHPYIIWLFLLILPSIGLSHPIPDLPVFGSFDSNGTATVMLEIDPRGFASDPEAEPFLTPEIFDELNASSREHLLKQARELVEQSLLVRLGGKDWFLPNFNYQFTERSNEAAEGSIILVEASAELDRENNSTYQIKSKDSSWLDLIFTNRINGIAHRRVNVLFPGEESFVLQLPKVDSPTNPNLSKFTNQGRKEQGSSDIASTLVSFLRQGFVHVLPLGLDHILFVVGIFLLSRKWKPLLFQVSAFTLAHTLTLGMATVGWVSVPSTIVEPIIAGSIAFIALENIFYPKYQARRLLVVFFFGLIHGLGFAGALSELSLDPTVLLISLVGFNLGVEGGQLAVILLAFIGVYPFKDEQKYRRAVVVPVSLGIAGLGLYWMIERIVG
jgi:hypothetical protein